MPVYEYYCPKCECKFEKLQPLSSSTEDVACNNCSYPSKRVLSRFTSFSKSSGGETTAIAGTSSCAGCSSTSCDTCH